MKKRFGKCLRALAGMVAGLVLLDLFCTVYYNPSDYVREESRATDVIREPGRFTARANEGLSWAVTDDYGYNNPSVPGEDGVFALMMGSSHIEGFYVLPGDDATSQLNELLRKRGLDGLAYNIGISRHSLARNILNLDRALERFQPSGYVLLETRSVAMGASEVYPLLDGDMGRLPATGVVISPLLSRRPLVRALYRQILTLREAETQTDAASMDVTPELLAVYQEKLTEIFRMVQRTAAAHGVTPIVYYHPTLLLQEDGTAVPDTDERVLAAFSGACDAAGVRFLDLTEDFLAAYEREHILPHGFVNTAPGVGHLNAQGNRIVAEALCEEIVRREAER